MKKHINSNSILTRTVITKALCVALLSTFTFACANTDTGKSSEDKVEATAGSDTTSINETSSELEKVGYSIGYMMADGNKGMIDDLDIDSFELGFRDAYADKDASLTEEQMKEVIMSYQQKKQAEMMQKAQEAAKTNKAEGDAFLAENATKEGVKSTESGLQYKVLKPGTGKAVGMDDIVKVNYEGKLLDGTIFDSSYESEPAIFAAKQMIPGFAEGLTLMKEGGEYELYIPTEMAYGEAGNSAIEPNSTLIFKVEVIEVNPKMPEQPAQ